MQKNKIQSLFLVLLLGGVFSACVTNKQFQYLQKDDVNVSRTEIPKDTLLRKYDLVDFQYKIQAEDLLSIQVYSLTAEEFDFFALKRNTTIGGGGMGAGGASGQVYGYLVDEQGNVEFPTVGKVKLAGLTVFEAQDVVKEIAIKYLASPVVEIRLLNFRFTVLGEVKKEGVFVTQNNRITMMEAIGLSGGFIDFADKANIKVIRQHGGEVTVYYLDLLKEELLTSPYYYIHQNDVIIVPPLKQRPYQNYFGRNLALLISSVSLLLLVISVSQN
jgi:polysaccharide biosynthesis/export protein